MSFTMSLWTLCVSQTWNIAVEREAVLPYTMRWYLAESLSTQEESTQGSSAVLITCGSHKKDLNTRTVNRQLQGHTRASGLVSPLKHTSTRAQVTYESWEVRAALKTPPLQLFTQIFHTLCSSLINLVLMVHQCIFIDCKEIRTK